MPEVARTAPLAVWSLILGIVGLLLMLGCVGVLLAIPAVICGHVAYARIHRSAGRLTGTGMAIAGLIMGYITVAMSVLIIPLMAAIAIPNFVRARQAAQENACVNNLRMIDSTKQAWAQAHHKTGEEMPTEEDLRVLMANGTWPVCPAGGTYTIHAVNEPPTCSIPQHALPLDRPRSLPGE